MNEDELRRAVEGMYPPRVPLGRAIIGMIMILTLTVILAAWGVIQSNICA